MRLQSLPGWSRDTHITGKVYIEKEKWEPIQKYHKIGCYSTRFIQKVKQKPNQHTKITTVWSIVNKEEKFLLESRSQTEGWENKVLVEGRSGLPYIRKGWYASTLLILLQAQRAWGFMHGKTVRSDRHPSLKQLQPGQNRVRYIGTPHIRISNPRDKPCWSILP